VEQVVLIGVWKALCARSALREKEVCRSSEREEDSNMLW
jgi:hypothetical protein